MKKYKKRIALEDSVIAVLKKAVVGIVVETSVKRIAVWTRAMRIRPSSMSKQTKHYTKIVYRRLWCAAHPKTNNNRCLEVTRSRAIQSVSKRSMRVCWVRCVMK